MPPQAPYSALEVSGHYLAGLDNAPLPATITRLRHHYDLNRINRHAWYPADTVLGFYAAVEADEAGYFDLVTIGRHVAGALPYPAGVVGLYAALLALPALHRAAWRGGLPGEMAVRRVSAHHAQLVCKDLPLPVDLLYGLCYGIVERFVPDAAEINVQRVARGSRFVFDVRW